MLTQLTTLAPEHLNPATPYALPAQPAVDTRGMPSALRDRCDTLTQLYTELCEHLLHLNYWLTFAPQEKTAPAGILDRDRTLSAIRERAATILAIETEIREWDAQQFRLPL